jgi:CheY-like chemotaxis protein
MFGEYVQFNANQLQAGNGSGLGLYIAKGIVEQHGGSLEVASDGLNKGTTFTLTLPMYKILAQNDSNQSEKTMRDVESTISRRERDGPLRVLLVDDSGSNRKMLKRILQFRDYICDEAADGVEAVEKYMKSEMQSDPYDAILMDNAMPNMNGPEAAKEIRELGCQYLIVGITGNVSEGIR